MRIHSLNRNLVLALLAVMAHAALAGQEPGVPQQEFALLEEFTTSGGETIRNCRVGYRTAGVLNREQDNVLIFPTWHTGTSHDLFASQQIGPGLLADTDRFYVIAIDALANGVSCSPSNLEHGKPQDFPEITIADMVSSQYRVLTEKFGIDHVRVILGESMGAMQALQWAGQYPRYMNTAVAIEGSPAMTSYDLLQWRTHVSAIDTMLGAGVSMKDVQAHVLELNLLTLWTRDYLVSEVPAQGLGAYLDRYRDGYSKLNMHDYRVQTRAMITHNVFEAFPEPGNGYTDRVKARMLIINFDSDHMVNPVPGRNLALELGARYHEISTSCGHMGTVCEADQMTRIVHTFLD